MKLYNSLGRVEQEFIPYNSDLVTMYTCGPTVYNYAHIGNLRTYIFEDILEKTLIYLGYKVKRAMNITDVGHMTNDSDDGEDKMAKMAKEQNIPVLELAEFYTKAFFDDCDKLNIKIPEIIEPASKHIPSYINMIEKLLASGYAYESNGNIYFDITKMDDYYLLSGRNEEDLLVAVRDEVEEDLGKRNAGDFGLWFTNSKFKDQLLKWDSPFGIGYPGWHLECSALAINNLGENLDIHCGGVDNIFPHHTNEIAQSEAYLSHKWCNYWIHGEHLNDKSGKMSKSNGEFLTLKLLESKGYDPIVYRMFCLQSHYRKTLVFSYETLDMTKRTYEKLKQRIKQLVLNDAEKVDNELFKKYDELFKEALADDLNTANALTIVYDLLKSDVNNITKLKLIEKFDTVLSLNLIDSKNDIEVSSEVYELIKKRDKAKLYKDYNLADSIRNELLDMGIKIKDTKDGTVIDN